MWLRKSQQSGEWSKRGEPRTVVSRDQDIEDFWNIISVYFLLTAMKNQTVKLIQTFFLFNRLAWFDGKFETNCEKKPGIKCMDFRFLPHAKNINSF